MHCTYEMGNIHKYLQKDCKYVNNYTDSRMWRVNAAYIEVRHWTQSCTVYPQSPILTTCLVSQSFYGRFQSGFPVRILCVSLVSPVTTTCWAHCSVVDFTTLKMQGALHKLLNSSSRNIIDCRIIRQYSIWLMCKHFPDHLVLKHL
jgi:hypothetical protein